MLKGSINNRDKRMFTTQRIIGLEKVSLSKEGCVRVS